MEQSKILAQLSHCLVDTEFDFLGPKYSGKVRDCYVQDGKRILVTTDRLSCFDRVVTAVPFKGEVLTSLAMFWFDKVKAVIPHHVVSRPDANVIIGNEASVIPIEVVVRGYLTGSAWRDYQAGKTISGITLPAGMKKDEKFPTPLLTPSTKADKGDHDLPISESEILHRELVSEPLWKQIAATAFSLFEIGSDWAKSRGLILVDTKYEFGLYKGQLLLVDEIHTLDSSRYWVESSYAEKFQSSTDQAMLDKEPTRQWLLSQGFAGDGEIPEFTDAHRCDIARHYISSYEQITGQTFIGTPGDPISRMEKNLRY